MSSKKRITLSIVSIAALLALLVGVTRPGLRMSREWTPILKRAFWT